MSCARLFEVEALRDGRLEGNERTRFECHMAKCPSCMEEAKALDALAKAARAKAPVDELHVKRQRNRLLASFLVPPEGSPRLRVHRLVLALAVVAALVVGTVVVGRSRPVATPSAAIPSSNVMVQADGDARYSTHHEGPRETIALERGALRVEVKHATGAPSLLVTLPDGELEDRGTVFTVSVSEGKTSRVVVEEGSVILRLRGAIPVTIDAGETWPKPVATPATATSTPPPAAPPAPLPPNPGDEFRAAMAAFERGDNRGAETKFARFLAEHPRDARAEDAAYLRVIAFDRLGDEAARRAAVRDYLARFPNGFSRSEVERLRD